MWPAVGTEAWAHARARLVSASEASAALGLDRFRTPERLIADKLSRLDAAEGVDAETLLAIAALNPANDPSGTASAASGGARRRAARREGRSRSGGGRRPPAASAAAFPRREPGRGRGASRRL